MSGPDDDDGHDVLAEYLAVVARVDDAVAAASVVAGDALRCARGCDSCCAPGLSVLPVEAERVARHLEVQAVVAGTRPDRCVFLDDGGACQVYEARPLLCRTHGLALRMRGAVPGRGALRILDDVAADGADVSVCELNYRERSPTAAETLDADRILTLLITVDRRFRAVAGLPDDDERIPLAALLDAPRG